MSNIPGRKIGEICPFCKNGKLQPVTNVSEGDNGIAGPDGASWNIAVLDRLACDTCSITFEARERGKRISEDIQRGDLLDEIPDLNLEEHPSIPGDPPKF